MERVVFNNTWSQMYHDLKSCTDLDLNDLVGREMNYEAAYEVKDVLVDEMVS